MKPVVVKIYDPECEQCIAMHPIEKAAKMEFGTEFLSLDLEFAAMHENIFEYISNKVVDDEGNIELPCYIFINEHNGLTGHFTGLGTASDIAGHPVLLD